MELDEDHHEEIQQTFAAAQPDPVEKDADMATHLQSCQCFRRSIIWIMIVMVWRVPPQLVQTSSTSRPTYKETKVDQIHPSFPL